MSDTRLSPAALLLIGAILLPIVIESRVVIDWVFGVAVPFWWTVAVGVVVYGAILFWGTLPEPADESGGDGSNAAGTTDDDSTDDGGSSDDADSSGDGSDGGSSGGGSSGGGSSGGGSSGGGSSGGGSFGGDRARGG